LFLLVAPATANAVLTASESFWVDASAYADGQSFQNGEDNVAGTVGFTATNAWSTNTGTIRVDDDVTGSGTGLVHVNLAGAQLPGAADFRISHPRNASRALDPTIPVASTYFLSGLVRANSANPFAVDGDFFAMGFGSVSGVIGASGTNISDGFHLGIRRDDSFGAGALRLSAFGDNQLFDLGAAAADTTYMIVLSLTADAGGADSLTAWTDDGTTFTQALTGQSLETFSGSGDLSRFVIQQQTGNGSQITRAWADEMRLGTTFADVTAVTFLIPEPSTLLLAALGLLGLAFCGRRRKRRE
jgi:hypothetical protein